MAAPLRVVFAGGGTGGHLFPALAIADEVRKLVPDAEILFVGTKNKIEARVVPQKGYQFETIWIGGFRRSFAPGNIVFPMKVVVSLMQAYSILQRFQPHIVVGTGGYISGPVLYAASRKKIPTLIQEQNSYPGVTTRLLAKRVTEVHLTFESSKRFLERIDNVVISGNPTRGDLEVAHRSEAFRYFIFDERGRKTILVFGGSLGARMINQAVEKALDQLIQHGLRIIWQTGNEDYERAKHMCDRLPSGRLWVNAFIDRMDYAYAASDLVICRAGATTIAELTRLGKPAILVPYPFAAANHQFENARAMTEAGAAEIIDDHELSEKFVSSVLSLLDEKKLRAMSEASAKLGRPNAAREIAGRIVQLARTAA
ncbi:MAG: undecaprenyldiphospho-muramoylpentapeptide beta-N-acetylglucosaminyltransferase [Ignavibacteriae bacterium]|nr:undecaprenyldiphospho-muramoylpentapeptide beta-N-acetylglucosaminyltransferase [Ignavibacteria bacterium]MBI3364096.1 undecaprenyldiphospho-muramoylpentapeptide beta-N-acetylglucosaminyltransferase [Ignavibacteriota bacterium]